MNHGLRTISFPNLSPGGMNCSRQCAIEIAFNSVTNFLSSRSNYDKFDKVSICLLNQDTQQSFQKLKEQSLECSSTLTWNRVKIPTSTLNVCIREINSVRNFLFKTLTVCVEVKMLDDTEPLKQTFSVEIENTRQLNIMKSLDFSVDGPLIQNVTISLLNTFKEIGFWHSSEEKIAFDSRFVQSCEKSFDKAGLTLEFSIMFEVPIVLNVDETAHSLDFSQLKSISQWSQIRKVVFDNFEVLNDGFFAVINEMRNQIEGVLLPNVTTLSCSGCFHLSNISSYFIGNVFTRLKYANFNYCHQLTDIFMNTLLVKCRDLNYLSLIETGVCNIPITIKKMDIFVTGPLLINDLSKSLVHSRQFDLKHRVFIYFNEESKNICHHLKDKSQKNNEHDLTDNCIFSEFITQHCLSEKTICIIPLTSNPHVNSFLEKVVSLVLKIKTIEYSVSIKLLIYRADYDEVKKYFINLESIMKIDVQTVLNHLDKKLHTFYEQSLFAKRCVALQKFLKHIVFSVYDDPLELDAQLAFKHVKEPLSLEQVVFDNLCKLEKIINEKHIILLNSLYQQHENLLESSILSMLMILQRRRKIICFNNNIIANTICISLNFYMKLHDVIYSEYFDESHNPSQRKSINDLIIKLGRDFGIEVDQKEVSCLLIHLENEGLLFKTSKKTFETLYYQGLKLDEKILTQISYSFLNLSQALLYDLVWATVFAVRKICRIEKASNDFAQFRVGNTIINLELTKEKLLLFASIQDNLNLIFVNEVHKKCLQNTLKIFQLYLEHCMLKTSAYIAISNSERLGHFCNDFSIFKEYVNFDGMYLEPTNELKYLPHISEHIALELWGIACSIKPIFLHQHICIYPKYNFNTFPLLPLSPLTPGDGSKVEIIITRNIPFRLAIYNSLLNIKVVHENGMCKFLKQGDIDVISDSIRTAVFELTDGAFSKYVVKIMISIYPNIQEQDSSDTSAKLKLVFALHEQKNSSKKLYERKASFKVKWDNYHFLFDMDKSSTEIFDKISLIKAPSLAIPVFHNSRPISTFLKLGTTIKTENITIEIGDSYASGNNSVEFLIKTEPEKQKWLALNSEPLLKICSSIFDDLKISEHKKKVVLPKFCDGFEYKWDNCLNCKLEVEFCINDNTLVVSPATIISIEEENEIIVMSDDDSLKDSYKFSCTSTKIHPCGWYQSECGINILVEKYFKNPSSYLTNTSSIPVPYELFTEQQTNRSLPILDVLVVNNLFKVSRLLQLTQQRIKAYFKFNQRRHGNPCIFFPEVINLATTYESKELFGHVICSTSNMIHLVHQSPFSHDLTFTQLLPFMFHCLLASCRRSNFTIIDNNYIEIGDTSSVESIQQKINIFIASCILSTVQYKPQIMNCFPSDFKDSKTLLTEEINTSLSDNNTWSQYGNNINCISHCNVNLQNKQLEHIPTTLLNAYHEHIISLQYNQNCLSQFDGFYPNLVELSLGNNLLDNLSGIGNCLKLKFLFLGNNKFEYLPSDIINCSNLKILKVHNNPLKALPNDIGRLKVLKELKISDTLISSLPESIGNLNLLILDMQHSLCTFFPSSFGKLPLKKFNYSNVPWLLNTDDMEAIKTGTFDSMDPNFIDLITQNDLKKVSEYNCVAKLSVIIFKRSLQNRMKEIPKSFIKLKCLQELSLGNSAITCLPLIKSTFLTKLNLDNNPYLTKIDPNYGEFNLKSLSLVNCINLVCPPREVSIKGLTTIIGFLKGLQAGEEECSRTKLMLVGLGGSGKTTLLNAFIGKNDLKTNLTDGISIKYWNIQDIKFATWDFAGQSLYYNTHQFFLSSRAVYLLLWNVRLGHEYAGVEFWINSIYSHAPHSPVFIVGTHKNQVSRFSIPENSLKNRFPQIVGFYYVDSIEDHASLEILKNAIVKRAKDEPYMKEKIPKTWLALEELLISCNKPFLPWEEVVEFGNNAGLVSCESVFNATQFLHELGSIQHFNSLALRKFVITNPQWLVNVMKCLISVKNFSECARTGILYYENLKEIWKDYPTEMHTWLLNLTQEFDLTFPLPDYNYSIVPCLMSEDEPILIKEFDIKKGDELICKTCYLFEYIPAGLFNRLQVRLHSLCDSTNIWKYGCLLIKHGQRGILQKQTMKTICLKAIGSQPDNISFLVHEVLETLVKTNFPGIKFDYSIQCLACLEEDSLDTDYFYASTILKASKKKIPIIQCRANFHAVPVDCILNNLPADLNYNYQVYLQLKNGMEELGTIDIDHSKPLCLAFCEKDFLIEIDNQSLIKYVNYYLKDHGYNTCLLDDVQASDVTLEQILLFISDNFIMDILKCNKLFAILEMLNIPVVLLVLEQSKLWKESTLISRYCTDLYIDLSELSLLQNKLEEILRLLAGKSQNQCDSVCFLSYCWSNSKEAVNSSNLQMIDGAVGWIDPRELKNYLESIGISTWLDIEQIDRGALFEEIAKGLRKSNFIVVCISDEYANSKNCIMEFRFASVVLRKPMIVVEVGASEKSQWQYSEVGLLITRANIPIFDLKSKNDSKLKEVLDLAQKYHEQYFTAKKPNSPHKIHHLKEKTLLLQHQLLRQLSEIGKRLDNAGNPTPRLIIPDLPSFDTDVDITTYDDAVHVKFLCESEDGWHYCSVDNEVILPGVTFQRFLQQHSFYVSMVWKILKKANAKGINVVNSEDFNKIIKFIVSHIEATMERDSETLIDSYHDVQQLAVRALQIRGDELSLKRCLLPSGKILWLCPDHVERMSNAKVIERQSAQSSFASPLEQSLLKELCELDLEE